MNLTPNFTIDEMKCRCGCGVCMMNKDFMDLLQTLREAWGKPMILTSAYRCNNHNMAIKGSKDSQHLKGRAVDIHCVDGGERYRLLRLAFGFGFKGIGIDKSFIHLDNRLSPTKVVWCY